jgi:hypothetical protein
MYYNTKYVIIHHILRYYRTKIFDIFQMLLAVNIHVKNTFLLYDEKRGYLFI